jgi:2-keto-myo-inositol isomerase
MRGVASGGLCVAGGFVVWWPDRNMSGEIPVTSLASPRFALNHMAAPRLRPSELFALARALGMGGVEVRNDLEGNALLDGTPDGDIARAAAEAGVEIVSINALQRFNDWSDARAAEAAELADRARSCGAKALVLVPTNDGTGRANGERQGKLRIALKALMPILGARGLTGLVEPLGFETCSLRLKSEAAQAIEAIGGSGTFRLVHDTFHHHLAGEAAIFPALTGLVHISGVDDPAVAVKDMRDPHRVLVTPADRLGNVAQIRALLDAGYDGYLSFEPFAAEVHALAAPEEAIRRSMEAVRAGLTAAAA